MAIPADSVTHSIPQPTRLRFVSEARVYTVVLDQDLLGDWVVIQSWGGKGNQRGGGKVTHVPSFEAGMAMLRAIAKQREKRGYRLIKSN